MQLRIYALFNCSRKVSTQKAILRSCLTFKNTRTLIGIQIAIFNGVLFLISIVAFIIIMIHGVMRRAALIASAIHFPLPGCPAINGGLQWTLWMPGTSQYTSGIPCSYLCTFPSATGFEMVLCGFVLYKGCRSYAIKAPFHERPTLVEVLIGDNILYFLG